MTMLPPVYIFLTFRESLPRCLETPCSPSVIRDISILRLRKKYLSILELKMANSYKPIKDRLAVRYNCVDPRILPAKDNYWW